MDKELLKKLQKAYADYIAANPTKAAILDTIKPLLIQFDRDGLSIVNQLKILRAGGIKIGAGSLKKWRKLNLKSVENPPE